MPNIFHPIAPMQKREIMPGLSHHGPSHRLQRHWGKRFDRHGFICSVSTPDLSILRAATDCVHYEHKFSWASMQLRHPVKRPFTNHNFCCRMSECTLDSQQLTVAQLACYPDSSW